MAATREQSGRAIRILLADPHTLFRHGLRALLRTRDEVEVVAEADDGEDAVRLADQWRPDVVLMAVAMPLVDGIEATRRIRAAVRGTRVVLLTMHSDPSLAEAARNAGAAALLETTSDLSALVNTIRSVAPRRAGCTTPRPSSRPPQAVPRPPHLTRREREVLSFVAQGSSMKEAALRLDISVKTVETHRARIMAKLNVDSVAGLTRYAIARGILGT